MTGSLKAEKPYRKLNNRGVSLIELIVALLILGMVVVPILTMFTSAARANRVNAENNSADAVASNVMEALKIYGLEKITEGDAIVLPFSTFTKDPSNANVFTGKVREGTHNTEFDVKITLDTSYKSLNDEMQFDYSQFEEKNKDKLLVINPFTTALDFDEEAVKIFAESNKVKVEVDRSKKQDDYDREYEAAYEQFLKDLDNHVTPTPTIPRKQIAVAEDPLDEDDIKSLLKREITIIVNYEYMYEDYDPEKEYRVTAKMVYEPLSGQDEHGKTITDYFTANTKYEGEGFCPKRGLDDLKYLYLFYVPFECGINVDGKFTFKNDAGVENQRVTVENKTNLELNFYFVLQGNGQSKALPTTLSSSGAGGSIKLFGNMELKEDQNELFTKTKIALNIAGVKIEVSKDGELIRTLESTVEE